MKPSVFDSKMDILKKRKASAEKNVKKHSELKLKWEKEIEKIDKDIIALNRKYSDLSAEEMAEAMKLYLMQKEEKEKAQKQSSDNQIESNHLSGYNGGNYNEKI